MTHQHTQNPSEKSRAAAFRALARAALRADSSLAVRMQRFARIMAKARAIEAASATASTQAKEAHHD